VARNDFEIADSQLFVFSKKHRTMLSKDFGLVNNRLYDKGASLLDGAYIVEKSLAAGGNRSSYLVADTNFGRNLELIEYDLSLLDPDKLERCVADLCAASQRYKNLQIPHLLNLVDYRSINDKFYLVMEPCLDQRLRSFVLKHGNLTEKQVSSLALKMAEAAEAVSAIDSSLMLGGIRPDAIVWKKNGTALLTELGFVSDLIMNYSDALLVDAPYAAPERIAGEAVPASDLYSIGATMYFAITKVDPECYTGAVVSAINSKVSGSFSQLISRLLSFDPQQRGSAAELVHDLGGFLPKSELKLLGSPKGEAHD
jgi:serine/threonine protein kinase